jgi:hypothetical protein
MYLIVNKSVKYAFGSYEQVNRLTEHHAKLIEAGEIKVFFCEEGPSWKFQTGKFYEITKDEAVKVKELEVDDGQA